MVFSGKNFEYITATERLVNVLSGYYRALSIPIDAITFNKNYTLIEIKKTQNIKMGWYVEASPSYYITKYTNAILLSEASSNTDLYTDIFKYSFRVDGNFKIDYLDIAYDKSWFILDDY